MIVLALILLIVASVLAYHAALFWQYSSGNKVLMAVLLTLIVLGGVANWTLALSDRLPEHVVSRQPAGKLIDIQLERGKRAVVETDTAFYAIRSPLSAKKGEPLELRTMEAEIFRTRSVYLCARRDCSALAD